MPELREARLDDVLRVTAIPDAPLGAEHRQTTSSPAHSAPDELYLNAVVKIASRTFSAV
jgi:hypothetical protein